MVELNVEIAFATFAKRYRENRKNQSFDNSRLPAGSPMYYFCHGCFKLVDTKSEGWFLNPPPKHCDACRVLAEHGLLDDAKAWMEQHLPEEQPLIESDQHQQGRIPP